jgi:branched-chain amino acid transport system permease protein
MLGFALLLALGAFVPLLVSGYYVGLATQVLIFALLAMSIDIMAGYAGRTTLCHGAIFGISTYGVLYAFSTLGLPLPLAIGFGIALAVTTAAIFALLAIRTSGVYFLLLTLALGMIVWGICVRWTRVTGGENGLRGDLRPAFLMGNVPFYYVVLLVSFVLMMAMWRFVNSPFGMSLRGIKESDSRMQSLGYNTGLHLFVGFTVSGLCAGIAGAIYALYNNFVSPSTVALTQSVEGLLMAIIGGVGTLWGGLIGAATVILLQNFVSAYTERWPTILGLTFIATMIFAPEGILGKLKGLLARINRAKSLSPDL